MTLQINNKQHKASLIEYCAFKKKQKKKKKKKVFSPIQSFSSSQEFPISQQKQRGSNFTEGKRRVFPTHNANLPATIVPHFERVWTQHFSNETKDNLKSSCLHKDIFYFFFFEDSRC